MTKDEYISQKQNKIFINNAPLPPIDKYSEPKYECEKCCGNMRKDLLSVCLSYPPKYKYVCDKCGNIDYLFY